MTAVPIDSTVITLGGKKVGMNPFRSRSTVMGLACLLTLISINGMAVKTGFFNETFALVSVYIVKDILLSIFGHQKSVDPMQAK